MKTLVLYSSLTGNTEKLAIAMAEEIEDSELLRMEDFNQSLLDHFDLFLIGYWVDKGDCDAKTLHLLSMIEGKHIALFGTLGAKENSDYYQSIKHKVEAHAEKNLLIGHFLCQGSVGEKTIERYRQLLQNHPDDIHMKAQLEAYQEGILHPDEQDIQHAVAFAASVTGN